MIRHHVNTFDKYMCIEDSYIVFTLQYRPNFIDRNSATFASDLHLPIQQQPKLRYKLEQLFRVAYPTSKLRSLNK